MANVKVVVKPGRTLVVGEAQKGADGKPTRPKTTRYGPGKEVSLPKEEAEAKIKAGVVAKTGTDEAEFAKRQADVIPDNFPGQKELAEAGIESFSAVPRSKDELMALEGIGEKKADAILKALPEEK